MKAVFVLVLTLASTACTKAETKPPVSDNGVAPPAGGGRSDASLDATADGNAPGCPTLSNNAAPVGERYVDVAVPTALGGTIASGTYFLTAVNAYTGVGGNTGLTGREYQETLLLEAATYTDVRAIGNNEGGARIAVDSNGSFTTSMTTFAFTPICPAGASARSDVFTASTNALHLFEGQTEFIFTLQ